jgi:cytochrome c peroxidase
MLHPAISTSRFVFFTKLVESAKWGAETGRRADDGTRSAGLAKFVRTIVAGDAPFDRNALSAPARHGLALFAGKAGCFRCHPGPLLTDGEFHNTGIAWRGEIAHSAS